MLHHVATVAWLNPTASLTGSHALRTSLHSNVPLAWGVGGGEVGGGVNKKTNVILCFTHIVQRKPVQLAR